jgi:hypothetical protein
MTRSAKSTADDYPQLEAFFCGYLHQDYPDEHGAVAGAVAAYRRDARASERRAVKKEWKAFRAATEGETLKSIGAKLTRGLGSAWAPRRRSDLDALDALIASL